LLKIVIGQQVSTARAHHLAKRVASMYGPFPERLGEDARFEVSALRALGLPARRAQCCADIAARAKEFYAALNRGGAEWESLLATVKGVGPWTIGLFRIAVLRELDVLPSRDVGLLRAIRNEYGSKADLESVSQRWRPYRSVACWYLWRSLGNIPLV